MTKIVFYEKSGHTFFSITVPEYLCIGVGVEPEGISSFFPLQPAHYDFCPSMHGASFL